MYSISTYTLRYVSNRKPNGLAALDPSLEDLRCPLQQAAVRCNGLQRTVAHFFQISFFFFCFELFFINLCFEAFIRIIPKYLQKFRKMVLETRGNILSIATLFLNKNTRVLINETFNISTKNVHFSFFLFVHFSL